MASEPTRATDPPSLVSPGISIADAEDPNRPKRVMGFRDLLLFYVVTGISLRWAHGCCSTRRSPFP